MSPSLKTLIARSSISSAAQFLRPPQEEVVDPVGVGLGQAAGAGERCHEPQQVEAILSVKVPGPGGDLRPKSGALLGLDQAQPEVVEGRRQRAQEAGPGTGPGQVLQPVAALAQQREGVIFQPDVRQAQL